MDGTILNSLCLLTHIGQNIQPSLFNGTSADTDRIKQLLAEGVIRIDIQNYVEQTEQIIKKACQTYTQQLPKIFAAPTEQFKETKFDVFLDTKNILFTGGFERKMRAANAKLFSIIKGEDSTEVVVTLLADKEKVEIPSSILNNIIADAIKDIIFSRLFPKPFIASAERTGAAIFRKELNFARNRLLEEMSQTGKKLNPMELLFKVYQDYALPIEENVDFARELETIFKKRSFLAENHPDILTDFAHLGK